MIVQLFALVKNGPRCYIQPMRLFIKLAICVVLCVVPLGAQSEDQTAKVHRGKELMAAGRFEEAIPLYRDLVKALPNNPGPMMNLGLALHMAGHEREAVSQFQSVLKLDPNHLPARLFLGAAYLGLRAPDRAIEPLKTVVRAQPDNKEARLFLGQALSSLERHQEAAEQYEKLSKLDPQNPKVWNGLGLCYESLTSRSFEELEKVAPESAYWLALVAEALAKDDKNNRAFFFYRQALAKMPDMRGIHATLAAIYRREGHSDWAATEEERERKLPPLNCSGSSEELECVFWEKRYNEVVALSKEAKTADALFWRTRACSELAQQAFDRLAQLPASAEAHELMAKVYFGQRRFGLSTKEWQEALKLSPGNPYYRQGLAISLSASSDYEPARQIMADLIKELPDSPELNYWLGFTMLGLDKPEAAIPLLEKGVQGDPSVLPAHKDLARAYLRVGEVDKAIPHLKIALPIDEDGGLYYLLATAYRKNGQKELEKEMLAKFQEIQASTAAEKKKFDEQIQITPP
jgi:tetratricopeptide (TPR) repeat protein